MKTLTFTTKFGEEVLCRSCPNRYDGVEVFVDGECYGVFKAMRMPDEQSDEGFEFFFKDIIELWVTEQQLYGDKIRLV